MVNIMVQLFCMLQIDTIMEKMASLKVKMRLMRYRKQGAHINFVGQGGYELEIAGDLKKFEIHHTSHLKSNTFIECSGGVKIGKYFHVGRGLTIFSTNHNYKSQDFVPYDHVDLMRPVTIGDAVWIGTNVTIAPGATIGNGVIVSSGSVVFGDIPECAIVRGNPAQVIDYRDKDLFNELLRNGKCL